jgi:integrase
VKPRRVADIPLIPLLHIENARQGFLSRADFEALASRLTDPDVRDFVEWFWWTGMRPNEIRQLTWSMLDDETRTLNLDPKAAKTRRGRVIAIEGPLKEIITWRRARRRLDCTLIFHRTSKGKPGQPIKDIAKQWKAALFAARLPAGLLPYDLRRSALRNMVRGGTDYTVAMKISGHRTRSTFDRYNITSAEDVKAAILRTADYVATLPTERNVENIELSQKSHTRGRSRRAR